MCPGGGSQAVLYDTVQKAAPHSYLRRCGTISYGWACGRQSLPSFGRYSALSFAIFALAVSVTRSMAAYSSLAWPFSLSASDFRLAAAPAFRS